MSSFYLHLLLFYFCSCCLCKQQHTTFYAKKKTSTTSTKKKAKEKLTEQEWGKLMIIINKFIRFWCLFVVECPTKSSFILGMYSQNAGSHV